MPSQKTYATHHAELYIWYKLKILIKWESCIAIGCLKSMGITRGMESDAKTRVWFEISII